MRLISWNIDSLNAALTSDSPRAQLTRSVLNTIKEKDADIIAIQETKLRSTGPTKKHQEVLAEMFPNYDYVWRSSEEPARKGYAGTMFLYKNTLTPEVTKPAIGAPDTMDYEGRILTLEFDNYYVTQVYTPNSGNELKRLEERQGFEKLLKLGFTDTFRKVHGNVEGVYSWWAQRVRTSKDNNSGWRIDYYIVSDRIADQVTKSEMIDTGDRKDHCPIMLEINL